MDEKLVQIQKLLDAADGNLSSARAIVKEMTSGDTKPLDLDKKLENVNAPEEKVIEGVFNGDSMVAPDGQIYPIPPNYASKSKLVEGDTLKLTISNDGSFVFKQISPVERRSAVGTLAAAGNDYTISAEGKSYKVLTASVTFYKAQPGDQITIVLPRDHDAVWAVMENVIKKTEEKPQASLADPSRLGQASAMPPAIEEVIAPAPEEVKETPSLSSPTSQIESDKLIGDPEAPAGLDSLLQGNDEEKNAEVLKPVPSSAGRQDDSIVVPEPDAVAKPEAPVDTPQIEFPGGSDSVSDEQLLENLKNNLKNLEQPAYTAPEVASTKPVDNIVANDLAKVASDKPIAELDI